VLLLDVSARHGAEAAPGLVYTTEACAASRHVYTQGPELHLDLVGQQEPVLILAVSTVQGRELHLESWTYSIKTTADCSATGLVYTTEASAATGFVCTTEAFAAPGYVYTLGPELHLDVSNLQRPVRINYLFALLSRLNQFLLQIKIKFSSYIRKFAVE
jgi:hypothetical protein